MKKEKIFQISVEIHVKKAAENEVVVDITVQEKNITFPAYTKLRVKVITKRWKIAQRKKIQLRRSYRRELKKLLRIIRCNRNKNTKLRNNAMRRIKTIANAPLNDIARKFAPVAREKLARQFQVYFRAIIRKRAGKNRIYSLHEPEAACITKGKEHKKYEFGNKVAFAQTITDGIIVGAQNAFNEYDGKCLAPLLDQVKILTGKRPERVFCDRAFRGKMILMEEKL